MLKRDGGSIARKNANILGRKKGKNCNATIAEKIFIGHQEILENQKVKSFFVRENVIVHGKTKMCVAGKILLIGLRDIRRIGQ